MVRHRMEAWCAHGVPEWNKGFAMRPRRGARAGCRSGAVCPRREPQPVRLLLRRVRSNTKLGEFVIDDVVLAHGAARAARPRAGALLNWAKRGEVASDRVVWTCAGVACRLRNARSTTSFAAVGSHNTSATARPRLELALDVLDCKTKRPKTRPGVQRRPPNGGDGSQDGFRGPRDFCCQT